MKTYLRLIFKDPGTFLGLGDAILFLMVNPLAFTVMCIALILIVLSRLAAHTQYQHGLWRCLCEFNKNPCWGLEVMGYACLVVAFLAMTQEAFVGFICSTCFGFANLLMADRLNEEKLRPALSFSKLWQRVCKNCSITPLLLALLSEPIVLIALGMLYAGLAAGGVSLITLPFICLAPYIAIVKTSMCRSIPQICLAICSIWYTCVGFMNHKYGAMLANLCFTVAYLEIAYQERRLYLRSHAEDL